jgi:phosphoribosylaminoimidazole-succinocarboxamide synthase
VDKLTLQAQLAHCLASTQLDGLGARTQGKVRDVYVRDDHVFLVATDRLSAFDKVLTTIPFKGEVLTRLSHFWFERTKDVVANHVLDLPDPNVTVARRCEPFAVEVVVRSYLSGSLWRDYQKNAHGIYGIDLPAQLKRDQQFESPLLTPSTKETGGKHDAPISEKDIVARGLASARDWQRIREAALALFEAGQQWARSRGLILVDTKYEFGKQGDALYVIDEIHTPDSSRYWVADEYEARFNAGQDQRMLDKENIRQWLIQERGFSGEGPLPSIPDDVRMGLADKYLQAFERITGSAPRLVPGPVAPRLEKNLRARGFLPKG